MSFLYCPIDSSIFSITFEALSLSNFSAISPIFAAMYESDSFAKLLSASDVDY